ncbi:phenylalanine--tRNA ligase beta subunit-related protein [Saprospiraceae bacterium]|nr:phenylalanine--tRNA ligase beta subunit-related protein [Saprospiraceae bacterium]
MIPISISSEVKLKCPHLHLGCVQCNLIVTNEYHSLLELIKKELSALQNQLSVADISKIPAIQSSRIGYKSLGKDPARYRLSAEALLRRVIKGKGLYQVNNVVDLLNLTSVKSGFSIGGYDVEKVVGDIQLSIGKANEPYEAIGRGKLNIESLPTFRDQKGPFGTPTSDSVRTMVSPKTQQFLMPIFNFGGIKNLEEVMSGAIYLLEKFAAGSSFESQIIS